jgi:hypothetical protein
LNFFTNAHPAHVGGVFTFITIHAECGTDRELAKVL